MAGGGADEAWVAQELGSIPCVDLLGRVEDVPSLLQGSRLFVLPSRFEGMPNALLETLSCGVPAVVSDVSGSRDLVRDGYGRVVVPGDSQRLVEALVWFMGLDEGEQASMRERAAMAMREYDLKEVLLRWERVYAEIVEGR